MRSRFTAFAIGDSAYVQRSWHVSTRPRNVDLDDDDDDDVRWTRLDIVATEQGGPFDHEGSVTFEAFYRDAGERGSMRERSRFVKEDRVWFYVDGTPG